MSCCINHREREIENATEKVLTLIHHPRTFPFFPLVQVHLFKILLPKLYVTFF